MTEPDHQVDKILTAQTLQCHTRVSILFTNFFLPNEILSSTNPLTIFISSEEVELVSRVPLLQFDLAQQMELPSVA
jgi:hypothetical protein